MSPSTPTLSRRACSLALLLGVVALPTNWLHAAGLRGVVHAARAKTLPAAARRKLARDDSVVVGGSERHFFSLYDRNAYEKIPSFVTLDAILHVFHVRFDALLADAEAGRALPALRSFAHRQLEAAVALFPPEGPVDERLRRLALVHAVPLALLDEEPGSSEAKAPWHHPALRAAVEVEVARIRAASGAGGSAICPQRIDYTLFEPRGHYANYRLRNYFQAMTFYAKCAFDLERDEELLGAADIVRLIDAQAQRDLDTVRALATLVVGRSDDPGVNELRALLPPGVAAPAQPLPPAALPALREGVRGLAPAALPIPTSAETAPTHVFRLLGTAALPDGSLFAATASQPSARALPSVLDLLAALGSADARALLATEIERVPALKAALQQPMAPAGGSVYARWLELLRTVVSPPPGEAPAFARTPSWARHLTIAAAASWAELRHDTVLYVKQPVVWAEGGHPEELPAVRAAGYVEPRPDVFRALNEMLTAVEPLAPAETISADVTPQRDLLGFLTEVAELELAGEPFPRAVDRRLREIGSELEELTRGHADELPLQALIADVFTALDEDGAGEVLYAATGDVDELWVIVPRAGKRVLMRGGVFSFYEITHPAGERLGDRDWRIRLIGKTPPRRPDWAAPAATARRARRMPH